MEKQRVTTKIWQHSLYRLKVIAALSRETMIETLARLIDAEYERLRKEKKSDDGQSEI